MDFLQYCIEVLCNFIIGSCMQLNKYLFLSKESASDFASLVELKSRKYMFLSVVICEGSKNHK
jgi:hypothetical protein